MADLFTTVQEQLSQIGDYLMTVNMFPVFFAATFSIASVDIRDDSKDLGPKFRQYHPFTSWLCTVVAGLSGAFVVNFIYGNPLVAVVTDNVLIIFITIVWYLINYSPFDVVYKIVTFTPVYVGAATLQECLRVRFIYLGIQQAANTYPGSYIAILLGGIINGNGYGFIKIAERLIRGKWTPATNELLDITYFTRSALYASVLFLLHHLKLLVVPIELLYLGVIITFVTFRMMLISGSVTDPLLPLEAPFCYLFFGSDSEEEFVVVKQRKQK